MKKTKMLWKLKNLEIPFGNEYDFAKTYRPTVILTTNRYEKLGYKQFCRNEHVQSKIAVEDIEKVWSRY